LLYDFREYIQGRCIAYRRRREAGDSIFTLPLTKPLDPRAKRESEIILSGGENRRGNNFFTFPLDFHEHFLFLNLFSSGERAQKDEGKVLSG